MRSTAVSRRAIWPRVNRTFLLVLTLAGLSPWDATGQERAAGQSASNAVVLLDVAGTADVLTAGAPAWSPATAGQPLKPGDRFRTGKNSRATLRLSDLSRLRLGELSELQVQTDPDPRAPPVYRLWRGILYFFHRDKPGRFRFDTPTASAAVRGTEFTLEVDGGGGTTLNLLDGEVELSTPAGQATARSGHRLTAEAGAAPTVTAMAVGDLMNAVQWFLYYPAVLDLEDLELAEADRRALEASFTAYRSGDLLAALRLYPAGRTTGPVQQAQGGERVYRAALLLAAGQVEEAGRMLDEAGAPPGGAPEQREVLERLVTSLRRLIAVVKGERVEPMSSELERRVATEWMVDSYVRQGRADLPGALRSAREAARVAPASGFAWARVAELEFGFGQTRRAQRALQQSLALAPRQSQGHVLQGFLFAAANHLSQAEAHFDRAIELDGSLGNAWLGRGLCLIRRGKIREGLEQLQTAALVEPRRALLRSYLGKAYESAGFDELALKELRLAQEIDPRDPTPWLYLALLRREQNDINGAVRDVERSVELNEQRALYRSRLLLDQDRAVRSSSLANLYGAAGMPEVSLREAVRAVGDDYANYSGHLFVSDSYNALREPTRSNLRYETVWFSELLLADLLAPAGGAPLSQHISQQEYARLFEQERLGLSSATEYRSDGQIREVASQFGRMRGSAWSLDLDYEHHDGVRVNQGLDRLEWYSTFKQDLSPQGSMLLLTKYQDFDSGDTFQYYSPTNARPRYRFAETQHPILAGGYHHEWGPGIHTLLLAGRLENDALVTDVDAPQVVRLIDALGQTISYSAVGLDVRHRVQLETYSAEVQQIFENERHALLIGARWQGGQISTHSLLTNPRVYSAEFASPASAAALSEDFERVAGYAYETVRLPGGVRVIGGVTYERMRFPRNFRHPPVASGEESRERLEPKGALLWEAARQATFRAAWMRSLGGVSLDESYRLEPAQLAGFVQDYRTLIPESLASSVAAPDHEIWGVAADLKFPARTYVTVQGQVLRAEVHQWVGAFDYAFANPVPPRIASTSLRQRLGYEERSAGIAVNQLLADCWSLGLRYAYARSALAIRTPGLASPATSARAQTEAELHQVALSLGYQHPAGFFGRAEARWSGQENLGGTANLPGDAFAQIDLFAGYRLPRQRGDLTLGLLNVTGDDYRLNPVTVHEEFPRERVLYARLRFKF